MAEDRLIIPPGFTVLERKDNAAMAVALATSTDNPEKFYVFVEHFGETYTTWLVPQDTEPVQDTIQRLYNMIIKEFISIAADELTSLRERGYYVH